MHYNSITKKISMCLLLSIFLLYPVYSMDTVKNKYHSQFSILEFYLIRLYENEKCGNLKYFNSEYINWCLEEFPKVNESNIELHYYLDNNSTLANKINKAPSFERIELILKGLDDFINYHQFSFNIYYGDKFDNREIKEKDLIELIDLYIHYCVGNKCYVKKDKIKS